MFISAYVNWEQRKTSLYVYTYQANKVDSKRAQEKSRSNESKKGLQIHGRINFMFKSLSSVGEGWHKPARLWSPAQHMKNGTLRCKLIHLHKSLNWDMNLKVQWQKYEE